MTISLLFVNLLIIMVNLSAKAGILTILRERAGAPVSGTVIAGKLEISRVAVWKAARSLQDLGYPIFQGRRGYRIDPEGPGDFLYPWEFGEQEKRFRHWECTGSTMDRARELADQGSPGAMVIAAETQTAGRGSNGRTWISPAGGLFCSLLERPGIPAGDYSREVMAVHVALGRAISGLCGLRARLRWPNGVYLRGKKAAGILTEIYGEGDRIRWMTTGVGVNINNPIPLEGAVNCAAIAGHSLSRKEALERILREIEELASQKPNPQTLSRLWNQEAEGIGQRVQVTGVSCHTGWGDGEAPGEDAADGEDAGVFLGIDSLGRGMVETAGGIRHFPPGSVSLRF